MSESPLDKDLCELAERAQRNPVGSRNRHQALTELIKQLKVPGRLCRPHLGKFQGFYDDIYAEAFQRLSIFVWTHIDRYDPERATVLRWANFFFRKRFSEAIDEFMRPRPKGANRDVQCVSMNELNLPDPIPPSSQGQSLGESVITLIHEDPEGIFQAHHIQGHPEANFQYIALQRYYGVTWRELSDELKIPIGTLSEFYRRSIQRFRQKIRDDLLE